ncbi:MAG: InlB B-repeat-containing protein, partial [Candidatus Bathyarchaeota archaeon]|nr:InlB B-repeat-containing protein [Candidatus Termiticorpusculum sp.]
MLYPNIIRSVRNNHVLTFVSLLLIITIIFSPFLSIFNSVSPLVLGANATSGVNGRILPAITTGDTSDWIEIAKDGEYSLILRKVNLPNSKTAFSTSQIDNYLNPKQPLARAFVNTWFRSTLNSNARLRDFTVKNTVLTDLGYFGVINDGFSSPTSEAVRTGDDVAFLLSFSEAALFCSQQYATGTSSYTSSSNIAQSNYAKLTIPSGPMEDFWWLRSPGAPGNNICSVGSHSQAMSGTVWGSSTNAPYPYIRPALWVKSSIFEYTITYVLGDGTNAPDNPSSYDISALPVKIVNPTGDNTFLGWNVTYTNGNGVAVTLQKDYTIPTGTYGDVTLTATWAEKLDTYSVTYNANWPSGVVGDGNVPIDSTLYKFGDTVTVAGNNGNLAVDGYAFTGWNIDKSNDALNEFPIYDDATLYAVWVKDDGRVKFLSYTVDYYVDGVFEETQIVT